MLFLFLLQACTHDEPTPEPGSVETAETIETSTYHLDVPSGWVTYSSADDGGAIVFLDPTFAGPWEATEPLAAVTVLVTSATPDLARTTYLSEPGATERIIDVAGVQATWYELPAEVDADSDLAAVVLPAASGSVLLLTSDEARWKDALEGVLVTMVLK